MVFNIKAKDTSQQSGQIKVNSMEGTNQHISNERAINVMQSNLLTILPMNYIMLTEVF